MNTISKTKKILICLSLVIIVAGAFLFGFLGFNQTKEERTTYQVTVSVEGYADADKLAQAKTVTENYFKEVGISPASVEKYADGATYRYVFNADVSEKVDVDEIKDRVSEVTKGVYKIDAGVYKVEPQAFSQSLFVILAGGIAVIACAVFVFITEKFAGAFTVVCSSVFAALLTVAIIALARIPAGNYAFISAAGAAALTGIAACGVLARCKEIMKNVANEKMSFAEVSDKATKDSGFRLTFLFIAVAVIAVAFFIFGNADTKCLALQILALCVASAGATFSVTPLLWTAFKSSRKNQRVATEVQSKSQSETTDAE